jgi:hypothetical protein
MAPQKAAVFCIPLSVLIKCSPFIERIALMSRLDDLGKSAPTQPPVIVGPVPGAMSPPKSNAFTEVTVKQLYFFMWKWLAASMLFGLPFWILAGLITILFRH